MKSSSSRYGFTLIEILVAATIVVAILSMVYGSYFATSKSTEIYKARIVLFQQGRKVLGQMARQIRCCYADYFNADMDEPSGEILHLVTTNGNAGADGLFEVSYKLDRNKGVLFLSRERFIGSFENIAKKRDWRQIAVDVESVELAFFDGQRWLNRWSYKDRKKSPVAVKIDIRWENEDYQQCHYGTVAYVHCRKKQNRKNRYETLALTKNQ